MWKILFQFLDKMWVLLGPEHNVPWSTTSVHVTSITKDDFSTFWDCVKCLNHPCTCIPSAV
jgi:hypothetical protein